MGLNRPNLQALVSPILVREDPLEAHRRAMTAQDKYNLDVQQMVSPIVAPIVWTALTPINNWVIQGGSLATPAWYQDYTGRVWLKGSVKDGDSNVVMFSGKVPAPAERIEFSVITNDGAASVAINLNGTIQALSNVVAGTDSLALNGLSYVP